MRFPIIPRPTRHKTDVMPKRTLSVAPPFKWMGKPSGFYKNIRYGDSVCQLANWQLQSTNLELGLSKLDLAVAFWDVTAVLDCCARELASVGDQTQSVLKRRNYRFSFYYHFHDERL